MIVRVDSNMSDYAYSPSWDSSPHLNASAPWESAAPGVPADGSGCSGGADDPFAAVNNNFCLGLEQLEDPLAMHHLHHHYHQLPPSTPDAPEGGWSLHHAKTWHPGSSFNPTTAMDFGPPLHPHMMMDPSSSSSPSSSPLVPELQHEPGFGPGSSARMPMSPHAMAEGGLLLGTSFPHQMMAAASPMAFFQMPTYNLPMAATAAAAAAAADPMVDCGMPELQYMPETPSSLAPSEFDNTSSLAPSELDNTSSSPVEATMMSSSPPVLRRSQTTSRLLDTKRARSNSRRRLAKKPRVFPCTFPACPAVFTLSERDLKRHEKCVHGPRINLPCGNTLSARKDNVARHGKTCKRCRSMTMSSSGGDGPQAPILPIDEADEEEAAARASSETAEAIDFEVDESGGSGGEGDAPAAPFGFRRNGRAMTMSSDEGGLGTEDLTAWLMSIEFADKMQ